MLAWVALTAIAAALVLVITNVVGPRARPHLTRLADTISVLSLFCPDSPGCLHVGLSYADQ